MSTAIPAWVRELAAEHLPEHVEGCLGTIRYIDERARSRGVAAVTEGGCVSLAGAVVPGPVIRDGDERSVFDIETFITPGDFGESGKVGSERIELDSHGPANTHLDGLAHVGIDGTWHGGVPCDSLFAGDDSLAAWARHGIATRAVLLDIPATRGTAWAEKDRPVEAEDLDRAVRAAGVDIESGDALLLYMGRDRFEAAGHTMLPTKESHDGRSGLGPSGARWIAQHRLSVLCWDFLDAHGPGVDHLCGHTLVWSVGMALVDNCRLGVAASALGAKAAPTGLVAIAPLAIPTATGCLVNPLLLF
jgi:hypothetical protein